MTSSAKPEKVWEGFRAVDYSLSPKVFHLPLTRVTAAPDGKKQAVPISLGEAWSDLRDLGIRECNPGHLVTNVSGHPVFNGLRVITESGDVVLGGPSFNQQVLETLLGLNSDGVNGFEATWFWYESDSSMDEPMDAHNFFVVHKGRIVRERVSFVVHYDSGFDPSLFESGEPAEEEWENQQEWWEAGLRLWYKKFYQDTDTGQLMVLRRDQPLLHHYPEGRWRPDEAVALLQERLAATQRVLWLLVLLVLCGLVLIWR